MKFFALHFLSLFFCTLSVFIQGWREIERKKRLSEWATRIAGCFAQ